MHWGRLKSDLLSRSQMLSEALSVGYFLKFIQTAPSGARSYLHPPDNPPFSRMLQPLRQKVIFFKTLGFWAFRSKREMRPDCQNYKTSTRQVDFPLHPLDVRWPVGAHFRGTRPAVSMRMMCEKPSADKRPWKQIDAPRKMRAERFELPTF